MASHGNLWVVFKRDCPIVSRVPVVRFWAFGVYARAYFENLV